MKHEVGMNRKRKFKSWLGTMRHTNFVVCVFNLMLFGVFIALLLFAADSNKNKTQYTASIAENKATIADLTDENKVLEQQISDAEYRANALADEAGKLREENAWLTEAIATDTFYFEKLGRYKATWYLANTATTGDTMASGKKCYVGAVAMNNQERKELGLKFGDELMLVMADKSVKVVTLEDTGCARSVIDIFAAGFSDIPGHGIENITVFVKKKGINND